MPGHAIRRLNQRSTALFAEAMNSAGLRLTPVQFAALSALEARPDMDQATLAAAISYDRATIGGVVDRLTARGLVHREVSEQDRRARVLRLTEDGRALLAEAMPVVRQLQQAILAPLDPKEQAALEALLARLLAE